MGPTQSCSYGDNCKFSGRGDGASPQLDECGAANCKRQLHHICQAEVEHTYKEQLGDVAMSKRCLPCLLKECGVNAIPSHVASNDQSPRRTSPRRQPATPEAAPRARDAAHNASERRSPRLLQLASAADRQQQLDANAEQPTACRSSPHLQQSKTASSRASTATAHRIADAHRRSKPDTSRPEPEEDDEPEGDDEEDVELVPTRKRGGQPGKRAFTKRVALSNEQKVKIVSHFLSYPEADRPTYNALAEWAKEEFKFKNLPSKGAISIVMKNKDEIMSKSCSLLPAPCCLLPAACSLVPVACLPVRSTC